MTPAAIRSRAWGRWILGGIVVGVLASPATTLGFELRTTPPGNRLVMNLNLSRLPFVTMGYGAQSFHSLAVLALASWNDIGIGTPADHRFFDVMGPGFAGNPCARDGINEVRFSSTQCGLAWGDALAVTITRSVNGVAVETDVLFNAAVQWDAYPGPLRRAEDGTRVLDFSRVAIHEFGHAAGLRHPDEANPPQQVTAIMNSRIGDVDRQQADDIAGARAIPWADPDQAIVRVLRAGTGTGTVTSEPPGLGCGAVCQTHFPIGTVLTLTAHAAPGSVFSGWSGGGCSGAGACTLTLTGATTITALFTPASPLVAALLPGTRSVQVGATATVFATMINVGATTLSGCGIALETAIPADVTYQATDPVTNALVGSANAAVSIGPGAQQTFVIAVRPTAPILSTEVSFRFACSGAVPAPALSGVNTLGLTAASTPLPDIVALAVAPGGILTLPAPHRAGAFAVAAVNLGAGATLTVSADTGSAALPLSLAICQTQPSTGQCLAPPGPRVTTTIASGETPTFGIFAQASGTIPFAPGTSRVFVRFQEGGAARGTTSVAVQSL